MLSREILMFAVGADNLLGIVQGKWVLVAPKYSRLFGYRRL